MTALFWFGIVLLVLGALIFAIFFWLNQNTPIQTRLPIVGLVMAVVGFVLLFIYAIAT
jgi:hypothetical protein